MTLRGQLMSNTQQYFLLESEKLSNAPESYILRLKNLKTNVCLSVIVFEGFIFTSKPWLNLKAAKNDLLKSQYYSFED